MNKKGYSIIEVIAAVSLFSILILCALSLQGIKIKLYSRNEKVGSYLVYMELLKNNIINNVSYGDLVALQNGSKLYINKSNINEASLKNHNMSSIFQSLNGIDDDVSYMKLNIENQIPLYIDIDIDKQIPVNILKIQIDFYIRQDNINEVMKCEFYKGKY